MKFPNSLDPSVPLKIVRYLTLKKSLFKPSYSTNPGGCLYQFHYIKQNKTWTEAQQYCREKHTDLVTVTNMKDMKRLINISAGSKNRAWIGLHYQTHGTRTWYWSLPGVEFDVSDTNWMSGEPTDKHRNEISGNCGFLFKSFTWADESCHHVEFFLCYDGE
uniref:C-type lectin domain-containing protein n=1 Tax=Poecilia latipinna TaxID=48699 RepID=A0A3B3VAL6_9TELE